MSIKEILSNQGNLRTAVQILLFKVYRSEFTIIDGLNQHPSGLRFEYWLEDILSNG